MLFRSLDSVRTRPQVPAGLFHRTPDCVGKWQIGWLADEAFLLCDICHGGALATDAMRERARAENESGELLRRLEEEGRPLL